jgi:hypothetical protein
MKKLLLLGLLISVTSINLRAQKVSMRGSVLPSRLDTAKRLTVPTNSLRQLRISLRSGAGIKIPLPLESTGCTSDVTKGPIPHGPNSVLYGNIEIRGPQRYRDKVIFYLKFLEEEAPLFYKMAQKQVKKMIWEENKKRSFAWPRRGHIHFAKTDFEKTNRTHMSSWFWLTLIHEIQHCCGQYGYGNEGSACYASWYYGNKVKGMKAAGYYLKYLKGIAVKKGATDARWEENLSRLRAVRYK